MAEYLKKDYIVISLDFQLIGDAKFKSEHVFTKAFANYLKRFVNDKKNPIYGLDNTVIGDMVESAKMDKDYAFDDMFPLLSEMCDTAEKPVVLIIDEVDSAINNQVFLDFLAQLRGYYLKKKKLTIFQSVILVGVYDVKNIKLKLRPDPDHKVNSPWNIATDFLVDMSFNSSDIKGMLEQYEADHKTGMDTELMAGEIFDHTSGYPFLVSKLCKLLDGFVWNDHNVVKVSNRIFETVLYNHLLSEEIVNSRMYDSALANKYRFTEDRCINMTKVLECFVKAFGEISQGKGERFLEEEGRKYFMLYLKPIINGTGHSYVEARARNLGRTDLVVDYLGEQFVIELKIWNGQKYHVAGEGQTIEYLD